LLKLYSGTAIVLSLSIFLSVFAIATDEPKSEVPSVKVPLRTGLGAAHIPITTSSSLTQDYFQKPATLYLGLMNSSDALIGDPLEIFSGTMDQLSISVGTDGNDAIQLTCESSLARFDLSSNVLYTNETQQRNHTGDKFFEFCPKIAAGLKVSWRSPTSNDIGGVPSIDEQPPPDIHAF